MYMRFEILRKIKSIFSFQKIPGELKADFLEHLFFANFVRYRIFTLVLLPVFAVLIITDLFNRARGLWAASAYHSLFYIHSATGILLLMSNIAFFISPPDRAGAMTWRHRVIVATILSYIVLSLLFTTFADLQIYGQITAYVIMAFAIGTVTLLRHIESLILYIACLTLFLVGLGHFVEDSALMGGHIINGSILTVMAWILSRVVYSGFLVNYLHEKKIEQQNVDIRTMSEKIRLAANEYRQLFENTPIGIFRTTREGRVLAANKALLRTYGFGSLDELNRTGLLSLYVDQSDRDRMWQELSIGGAISDFETFFLRADRSAMQVSISGYLVRDDAGKPLFFEGTIEDITERKKTERALLESEEKFRSIVIAIPHIVSIWTMDMRCLYMSPSIERVLGYTAEEGMTVGLQKLLPDRSIEILTIAYQTALERERDHGPNRNYVDVLEIEQYHKNGSIILTENTITFMRDGKDTPVGIISLGTDITERKRAEKQQMEAARALRQSEEQYRLLAENSDDVIFTFDPDLQFTYVSPAILKLRGMTAEEAVREKIEEIMTPASLNAIMSEYTHLLPEVEQGKNPTLRAEIEQYRKDGSTIWVDINMRTMRDDSGRLTGYVGVSRDISGRKRVEKLKEEAVEALRQREEQYRLLAENSDDVIFTLDSNLQFTYVSPAVLKLRGVTAEEEMRKKIEEIMTPASLNAVMEEYNRLAPEIEQGKNPTLRVEIEEYRKDGSTVWVDINVRTMRDNAGRLTGYVGVSREISERKRAEEELKLRNILLSTQQEVSIDGILVVDENGKMISFNRRFVEIWSIPDDVLESKSDDRALQWVMVNLVNPDEFIAKVRHLYENRKEISRDEITLKDGRVLDRYSAPMLGDDSRYYGRIWYFRDITDIMSAEDELKKARDVAEDANHSKSIFLANMSHEIRTPMNAILGFAQLMQRNPGLTAQMREYVSIINRSGEHLLSLINDILEMSKIEAGRSILVPKTFDLHMFLSDLEMMFRVRTDEKHLQLHFERVGDVPRWVITDEGKLRQVLINLLGNAVKFTDEGGVALRIGAPHGRQEKMELQFEVEDTGPGIAEEESERLFRAFEQTMAGLRYGGTGLGLALSRGFVQIMGGTLSLRSIVGKGSIFIFTIPVKESKEEETERKEEKRRVLQINPEQGEIRVLIADDRETNRHLLSQMLATVGFKTREAVNGAEAVAIYNEWKPSVVLMDMTMPVMDGYEATRRIKAAPDINKTVVIAVTASAFEEDRRRVLETGADGYLAKPFKESELFQVIHDLTGTEYLYEDSGNAAVAADSSITAGFAEQLREAIASLPADLPRRLRDAVTSADIDLLNELLDKVSLSNSSAAQLMREMAVQYRYEELLNYLS